MKIKDMPDWALKYKTKGYTLRQIGDHFGLYEATSTYVKGGNPKTKLTFVGIITEKDGLIPKKTRNIMEIPQYVEYGYTHFVYVNCKRLIQRSVFDSTSSDMDSIIRLCVLNYVFHVVNETIIRKSYLSYGKEQQLIDCLPLMTERRKHITVKKIDEYLNQHIPNDEDRITLQSLLMLTVIDIHTTSIHVEYCEEIKTICTKYEVKYE